MLDQSWLLSVVDTGCRSGCCDVGSIIVAWLASREWFVSLASVQRSCRRVVVCICTYFSYVP